MLRELIPDVAVEQDVLITGITDDSRRVKKGDLFLAMPGSNHDGRNYIADVAASAAAVLCERPLPREELGVPIIPIDDLRGKSGYIASQYFGQPSQQLRLVAVTGTNGKSSVANFVATSASRLGSKCGVIGTLGVGTPQALDTPQAPTLTTPDAITLQSHLAAQLREGCSMVALEASSHGLAQGRLNGTAIDVAAFTNISRDHLDFHDSFEAYLESKERLFRWPDLKTAVLNADDPRLERLLRMTTAGEKITYGLGAKADVIARSIEPGMSGMTFELVSPWGTAQIESRLIGRFNVSNLLATVSVLAALDFDFHDISGVLGQIENVPGRMNRITTDGFPDVVIDYAHTPDALANALTAVRECSDGKVWCVFGCGGDRDKGKRAEMGRIASSLADHLIVTNDNPRYENPGSITNDILKGIETRKNVEVELSRAAAINNAIESAEGNDVILIAGKGHEDYQEIEGERKPYSDFVVVGKCFSQRSAG